MEQYRGKVIVKGNAIGKIYIYTRNHYQVTPQKTEFPEEEVNRYRKAQEIVIGQLESAYEKAVEIVGARNASVFDIQAMLLREGKLGQWVEKMILNQKVTSEYAISQVSRGISENIFEEKEDWEEEERGQIREVAGRVLNFLTGQNNRMISGEEKVILAAKDITPGELLQFDKNRILGLITEIGAGESHTAVLASAMEIPYLCGIPFHSEWNGKMAAINGNKGLFCVEPEEKCLEEIKEGLWEQEKEKERLETLIGEKAVTLDGERMYVYANVGREEELEEAITYRVAGIGLVRSEYLFMGKENYPSEEEQYEYYRNIVEKMQGKPVHIRTLDIGADKQMNYLRLEKEDNPAMGFRGIRICLEQEELFRTQLKALFRAAVYGNLGILYPMITSVEEIDQIQEIIHDIREEMDAKGVVYGEVRQGVMIETPAAVMISDMLAEKVDFFSIGTNDLIQYVMAADRQNYKVASLCQSSHPAVIRMMELAVRNAHRYGIPVMVCGEMASDKELTRKLVEMGVDILSVAPGQILAIRKEIRNTTVRE